MGRVKTMNDFFTNIPKILSVKKGYNVMIY